MIKYAMSGIFSPSTGGFVFAIDNDHPIALASRIM